MIVSIVPISCQAGQSRFVSAVDVVNKYMLNITYGGYSTTTSKRMECSKALAFREESRLVKGEDIASLVVTFLITLVGFQHEQQCLADLMQMDVFGMMFHRCLDNCDRIVTGHCFLVPWQVSKYFKGTHR